MSRATLRHCERILHIERERFTMVLKHDGTGKCSRSLRINLEQCRRTMYRDGLRGKSDANTALTSFDRAPNFESSKKGQDIEEGATLGASSRLSKLECSFVYRVVI